MRSWNRPGNTSLKSSVGGQSFSFKIILRPFSSLNRSVGKQEGKINVMSGVSLIWFT